MAYDTVEMAIQVKNEQYQFEELFFRPNLEEVLREKLDFYLGSPISIKVLI